MVQVQENSRPESNAAQNQLQGQTMQERQLHHNGLQQYCSDCRRNNRPSHEAWKDPDEKSHGSQDQGTDP